MDIATYKTRKRFVFADVRIVHHWSDVAPVIVLGEKL